VERARLAWPGRRLGRIAPFVIACLLLIALKRDGRGVDLIPAIATNLLIIVAALIGGLQGAINWGRRLNPAWAMTPRPARGAWAFSLATLGPLLALGFALFTLAPARWNARAWVLLTTGSLAVGAHLAWGWLRLTRWTGISRPAGERFRAIAERAAERAGVRLRSIEQLALPMANAFAFVHDRSVAVTDAALAILDDDELSAICAHELAHLGEPGWVRFIRLSFGVLFGLYPVSLIVTLSASQSLTPMTVWLVLIGIPLILLVGWTLFLRLAHRMEIRADLLARPAETAPGGYATALEKIYEANLIPVVLGTKRRTHPELYDRMVAAGLTPRYSRPAAPPRGPWLVGLLALILSVTAGSVVVTDLVARRIPRAVLAPDAIAFWTAGAMGGTSEEACALAKAAHDRGDEPRELDLYRAAVDLYPVRAFAPAMLAGRLAQRGRCDEAKAFWYEAVRRDPHPRAEEKRSNPDASAIAWARQYVETACGAGRDAPPAPDDE
jgi:Zn-dependent protease with chaperone function